MNLQSTSDLELSADVTLQSIVECTTHQATPAGDKIVVKPWQLWQTDIVDKTWDVLCKATLVENSKSVPKCFDPDWFNLLLIYFQSYRAIGRISLGFGETDTDVLFLFFSAGSKLENGCPKSTPAPNAVISVTSKATNSTTKKFRKEATISTDFMVRLGCVRNRAQ